MIKFNRLFVAFIYRSFRPAFNYSKSNNNSIGKDQSQGITGRMQTKNIQGHQREKK